jgi:hypothetical protein
MSEDKKSNIKDLPVIITQTAGSNWLTYVVLLVVILVIIYLIWHYLTKKMEVII